MSEVVGGQEVLADVAEAVNQNVTLTDFVKAFVMFATFDGKSRARPNRLISCIEWNVTFYSLPFNGENPKWR
jgi:hypothetical protein